MSESKNFDPKSLDDLLAKVQAATGPQKSLDREIMCSIGGWTRLSPSEHPRNHKHPMFVDLNEGYSSFEGRSLWRDVPTVTASIDASLALVEKMLPGWAWVVGNLGEDDTPSAAVTKPDGDFEDFTASASTPPLAILAALLSALSSIKEVGK